MGRKTIHGVIVPLITPIFEDESVNWDDLGVLVDYVIAGGVDAIFAMGTTGEFARFDDYMRAEIIAYIVNRANGHVPVYAGVSDCGTRKVIDHVKKAEQRGVSAAVVTVPYYFPTTSAKETFDFFKDVAASTKIKVIVYNNPATVGVEIPMDVIERLTHIENIAAIKDSGGDMEYFSKLKQLSSDCNKEFSVIVGNENVCYEAFVLKADGIVSSMANPYPRLIAALYQNAAAGNSEQMKSYCETLKEFSVLNNFSDSWMSPNIWRKVALQEMGVIGSSYFTRPYNPVTSDVRKQIIDITRQYQNMFK